LSGAICVEAVLFDLDGTLADTAPDLIGAADRLLAELGRGPCDPDRVRPRVSRGGVGILSAAMPDWDPNDAELLTRYLAIYRDHICERSRLFPGMDAVLARLEDAGKGWGVVTNKATWLTTPLVEALGIAGRAGCIVAGDTLSTRKPDAAPVLHACRALGARPQHAAMLGDDVRDVEAAHNAGAIAVVVGWGYGTAECLQRFGNSVTVAAEPADLLPLLGLDR
jgi:phosphoglycolate phosphatase